MTDVKSPPFTGDYSRSLFRERQKYLGVLQEQGKPIVDADLIDQVLISAYRGIRLANDAFPDGFTGGAFKILPDIPVGNSFVVATTGWDGVQPTATDPSSYSRGYVSGVPATLTSTVSGNGYRIYGGLEGDAELSEIHHRSTDLTSSVLTDTNALFVPDELVGMLLIPNVKDGTAFEITANTETTIEVAGNLLDVAASGDFYTIIAPAPSGGERTDLVWLDVYIDEVTSDDDPTLLHPFSGGTATSNRLVVRQQIRISMGTEELPHGRVYTDTNEVVHYATPLALITRSDGQSDITEASITDLRNPWYGSSREVVEARGSYASIGDRMTAIDPNIANRYSATPTSESFTFPSINSVTETTTVTNKLSISGYAYTGESAAASIDDIQETLVLYTPDERLKRKVVRPSVIGSINIDDGITSGDLNSRDIQFRVLQYDGDTPLSQVGTDLSFTFTLIGADLDEKKKAILTAFNSDPAFTNIGGSGINARAVLIDSTRFGIILTGLSSDNIINYGLVILASSSASPYLFDEVDNIIYSVESSSVLIPPNSLVTWGNRYPKIKRITDIDGNSVVGGDNTGIPKFAANAVWEFDTILLDPLVARYGTPTHFRDEESIVHVWRDLHTGSTADDARLEREHDVVGRHRPRVIKDYNIDWGLDSGQVSAEDVPTVPSGDITATDLQAFLEELEQGKLSLGGGITRRTMQDDLFLGGFTAYAGTSPDPDQALVTKQYVDQSIVGIIVLDSVQAASTGNIVDDNPSASGIQLQPGITDIDGVPLTDGMRVLLKDQTNTNENTIYVYDSATNTLNVAPDVASLTSTTGVVVFVENGDVNEGKLYVMNTPGNPPLDGTAPVTWTQFLQSISLVAGKGINIDGRNISVVADQIIDPNKGLMVTLNGDIAINADPTSLVFDPVTGALGVNPGILTYSPADPSRWDTQPTDVVSALNTLADQWVKRSGDTMSGELDVYRDFVNGSDTVYANIGGIPSGADVKTYGLRSRAYRAGNSSLISDISLGFRQYPGNNRMWPMFNAVCEGNGYEVQFRLDDSSKFSIIPHIGANNILYSVWSGPRGATVAALDIIDGHVKVSNQSGKTIVLAPNTYGRDFSLVGYSDTNSPKYSLLFARYSGAPYNTVYHSGIHAPTVLNKIANVNSETLNYNAPNGIGWFKTVVSLTDIINLSGSNTLGARVRKIHFRMRFNYSYSYNPDYDGSNSRAWVRLDHSATSLNPSVGTLDYTKEFTIHSGANVVLNTPILIDWTLDSTQNPTGEIVGLEAISKYTVEITFMGTYCYFGATNIKGISDNGGRVFEVYYEVM